jgi:hypothetical protein
MRLTAINILQTKYNNNLQIVNIYTDREKRILDNQGWRNKLGSRWRRSSVGQSRGIIILVSGVRVPAPLLVLQGIRGNHHQDIIARGYNTTPLVAKKAAQKIGRPFFINTPLSLKNHRPAFRRNICPMTNPLRLKSPHIYTAVKSHY